MKLCLHVDKNRRECGEMKAGCVFCLFLGWQDMGEFLNLTFHNSVLVFLIVTVFPKLHIGQCLQLF